MTLCNGLKFIIEKSTVLKKFYHGPMVGAGLHSGFGIEYFKELLPVTTRIKTVKKEID